MSICAVCLLLSFIVEGHPHTDHSVDGPQWPCDKWDKPVRRGEILPESLLLEPLLEWNGGCQGKGEGRECKGVYLDGETRHLLIKKKITIFCHPGHLAA